MPVIYTISEMVLALQIGSSLSMKVTEFPMCLQSRVRDYESLIIIQLLDLL